MALNNFDEQLKQLLQKIEENVENEDKNQVLKKKSLIDKIKINSNQIFEIKSFHSFEQLFHFSIDCNGNYDSMKSIPKQLIIENKTHLRIDLEIGFIESFDNNKLITDYSDYWQKKWNYFLKCLDENQLISKSEPNFVSFGGPVANIMATVYDSGIHWKVLAQMFRGVIYLSKTGTQISINDSLYGEVNKCSFCRLKFLYFITDRNETQINEFENHFVIKSFKLDSHKLLTLNEIDAIDQNGKAIDVKVVEAIKTSKSQEFFNRKKLLRFWSKCSVQGIDKIVIGNRNSNNFLIDIEEREVKSIPENCSAYWSDSKCIEFLDRLLHFMKKCITEEMIVYEFSFNRGEEFVSCNRFNTINSTDISPQILPDFYINSTK